MEQSRREYWDSFPEKLLVQQSGIFDRRDLIRHVAELIGRPKVLEIGVDCGHVLNHCDEVFGEYTGVDVTHQNIGVRLVPRCPQRFVCLDSKEFWRGLAGDEQFDLVFVDGSHGLLESYMDITQAMLRLSDKGYVLAHDVNDSESPKEGRTSAAWSHDRLRNLPKWYARILEGHPEGISIYFKE